MKRISTLLLLTAFCFQQGAAQSLGSKIGQTFYDLQSNYASGNRLLRHPDGTLSATWTESCISDPASCAGNACYYATSRGFGYNYFDGTSWIHGATGTCPDAFGVLPERGGWPEMMSVPNKCGGTKEMILGHLQSSPPGGSTDLKYITRPQKGTGGLTAWSPTVPVSSSPTVSNTWPRAVSVGETIHMIASAAGGSPAYFRSQNSGQNWDKIDFALPAMMPGLDADNYAIHANGNTVAIIAGSMDDDWALWRSDDAGSTWTKKVIRTYNAANNVLINGTAHYPTNDPYQAVVVDNAGTVHAWAGMIMVDASGGFPTGTINQEASEGIWYWNDGALCGSAPQLIVNAREDIYPAGNALDYVGSNTSGTLGIYINNGRLSMPSAGFTPNNEVYVVYSAVLEGTSNNGNFSGQAYRDLYVMKGTQGGTVWSAPVNIANSIAGIGRTTTIEEVHPSVAHEIGADNMLHVLFQSDNEPGLHVRGDLDPEVLNDIRHYGFNVTTVTWPAGVALTTSAADVGVREITSPANGCAPPPSSQVCVTVTNFGSTPQSSIPVAYQLNSGAVVTGTVPGPLAPGQSVEYCFTTPVNIATAGTYTLQAFTTLAGDPAVCNNSATRQIISQPLPVVTITNLDSVYCLSHPTISGIGSPSNGTLCGPGVLQYTFTPSLAGIGTHSVSYFYTDANGCSNTYTQNITVAPDVTIAVNPTSAYICSGQSVTLEASGNAATYSWTPATGLNTTTGTTVTASPPSQTTYTVTGTGAAGCAVNAQTTISVGVFQTVVYETMGPDPVNSPVLISVHEAGDDFDNDHLLMTGAVSTTNPSVGTQVRITTPSSGYIGASGGNNVLLNFNSLAIPSYWFQIENINTVGLNNLMLSYGVKKQAPASNGTQLVVEYSTDGTTYVPLTVTDLLPQGAGTQIPWYLIDSIQGIPATPNLRLRWRQTANNMSFQIDDITLQNVWTAPAITPSGPTSFCTGGSVNLTSSAAHTYLWSTGDTVQTISVSQAGTYSVTVTDMNGCVKTSAPVTITTTPGTPPVATNNGPVCAGQPVQLFASGDPTLSYTWTDASGTVISNSQNPIVSPSASGIYTVTVTVPGCGVTSDTTLVNVVPGPSAPAVTSNSPVCAGETLLLSASSGSGYSYSWFGPGINPGNASQQNQVFSPATSAHAGTYSVYAYQGSCISGISTISAVVNPVPGTPAIFSNTPVCQGQPLQLSAQASVSPASYSWTFPDGNTSPNQVVALTAAASHNGYFSVFAISGGCNSAPDSVLVTVNPVPNSSFTYSSSAFCQTGSDPTPTTAAGVSGIFSSTPLGLVLDDSTGTIDVSASAVGSYTVTFTASGTCPSSSTQTVSIVTSPSACFSYAAQQYCQSATDPAPTACTNASFGVFSANPSGLSINPTTGIIDLSASLPGVYTIYNSIASSGGCAAALDSVEVEVLLSPAAPLATSNSPVCAGNTLQLSASGAYPAGTSFFWTGPGITAGTATQQHPAILAAQASASGTYSVVATLGSCSSPAASVAATVIAVPTPVITPAGPIAVCQGTPVVLTSSLASSGYAYQWQQGGTDIPGATTATYTVISSGSYTVRHTHVASNCSATSAPVTVTINPVPSAPLASNTGPVCAGGNLQLSASGTYPAGTTFLWSGPGITAATATQQHPLLTGVQASASGTYTVTATLGSCSSAPASTTATVNAVPATPLASSAPVCAGNTLTITVNNPLPGAVYSWITNTGAAYPATTSSLSIPGAQLSQTGTWTVYAASNGCTSPAGTVTVNVNNGPATPQLSNTGPVCAGESLQLSANGSSPTASYNWSLPNGSAYTGTGAGTSVITIPAATIAHNGTWTVVVSEAGCSAPAQTMSVTVTPVPSAPSLASNSPVCEGQSLNLTASSTAAGATYSWVYPDGSTSTAQNPVLSPATLSISGSYTVYAIVNGCVSPASTTPVVVLPSAVAPTIFTNSPVCEGEALQLSTVLVPGASYTWTTPGGNSLIGQVVTIPGALPTDSGTYTLNTPGSSGCGSAPGTVQVVVNALPDVPAVNSNSPVCFGSTITLSTAFVAGASYTWTAPDGQSYFGQSVSIPSATAADSGTYSVQVVTAASCASAVGTGTVVVVPAVSQGNVFSSSPVCQGDSLYLFASGSWPAGAVFSWTGPNYQTSLQNPVRANAQPSYSGSYTFSVSYNGCTSTPAVLQVVVHPSPSSPQASVNAPLCEGQDLLFTATAVGGGVYSWVNPQGQHFSSLQNPVITNATPAQSGVYTLYVTNGNNCTSVTPSYLTVIVKAMPQVNAVASTPLCEGQTLLLSTPLVQNAFYSWSGPAGFASTQHNPVRTNATLSMSGTYHVWVTREGCTAEDTVHVEVVPQPSAPVPFQPGDICEGTPLTLSAAGPALGHYVWTGPVSFTGQDTVILEAGLQHQGNYQVTVSVNGCTSPIGLLQNVVVLDAPNVNAFTLTASDTLICRGDVPVTLKATGAPIYSWSAPATGGLTGNPTLSQIQASPTATTTYTLVGSNTNGCRDTAYVTIRIAEPLVAEAGPDQSGLCGQDSVSLNAVAPVLGTGVWTIASGSGGVFSDNTSAQATFRGTAGQSYSLVWTVTSAVCGSDADTVQVSLQGNVAAPTATGYEACALAEDAPQPVSLAASGSAGVYEWYADSALTGSVLSYDSVYSVSLSQTSSYWVRSVENGCAGPAVEVRAVINPLPVVDAGVDVSIEQGQSTVLYASGAASYSWSPAMGLSAANVQSPVAAPIVSTTYTVSGTDAAGCTASDEVVVSLLPALAIPNGFTPNGDGSNDVWEISALTQGYPDCRVEIFNRWGGVVYASVGYFKPWDGKLEGKELPTATYYYMIYLKPGEAPIAGSVTIIR